jgi:hypothetical protein
MDKPQAHLIHKLDLVAVFVAAFGPAIASTICFSINRLFHKRLMIDELTYAIATGISVGTGVAGVLGIRFIPVPIRVPLAIIYGAALFVAVPVLAYFIAGFLSNFE